MVTEERVHGLSLSCLILKDMPEEEDIKECNWKRAVLRLKLVDKESSSRPRASNCLLVN